MSAVGEVGDRGGEEVSVVGEGVTGGEGGRSGVTTKV